MLELFLNYFLNPPARLKAFGRALSTVGVALIVAGIYLGAGAGVVGTVLKRGGVKSGGTTLAETFPGIPTWFVPETALGFVLAVLVVAVGLYATHFARKVERLT